MKIPFWTLFPALALVLFALYLEHSRSPFPEMDKSIRDSQIRNQELERLLEEARKQNK
jgi:hypothetical protein